MKKYDIIIIGSGLGGLLTGIMLSKEGKNVCILEKYHLTGGLVRGFNFDGIHFDTGVHYIGSMGEGQVLNQYFKYFGLLNSLEVKEMDRNAFDIVTYDGKDYPFANGHERFAEQLSEYFPHEKQGLKKYIDKLIQIAGSLPLYNLTEPTGEESKFQLLEESASDFISSVISDKTLINILAGANFLYAGIENVTPLLTHAVVTNTYLNSAWKIVDGSSKLADLLTLKFIEEGGTVFTSSEVVKLISKNGKIHAAQIQNGEIFEADYFISDIHPSSTFSLIDGEYKPSPFSRRIEGLQNTTSAFQLYITLKENTFPYLNSNYYYHNSMSVWKSDNTNGKFFPESFFLITPYFSDTGKYASSLQAMAFMDFDEVSKWENTKVGRRGKDYRELKKEKAELLIDSIEKKFPGFRNCIKNYCCSTPLTIRDYTGSPKGSLYGIVKDSRNPMKTYISHRTKIPNLLLTGQNVNFHGVIGVSVTAALTSSEFTGLNYLIKRIKNA